MTQESASAAVARAIFEAAGMRDPEAMAEHYRDDVTVHWLPVGEFQGKQAAKDFWVEVFHAVPDATLELENLISEGDTAVAEWRWRGTFSGEPYVGIHATGRTVDLHGCDVMRFADGLLAHETVYFDGLGWARQIGLLPGEGTAGDKALTAVFNATTDVRTAIHEWWTERKPERASS